MNKEELFYEAESKTARPHKYSIRYKQKDETIYPSMVIRSQAEAIELLKKENQQLKKQKDDVVEYLKYQLSNFDFEKDIKARMLASMIIVMLEDNRMLGEIDEY